MSIVSIERATSPDFLQTLSGEDTRVVFLHDFEKPTQIAIARHRVAYDRCKSFDLITHRDKEFKKLYKDASGNATDSGLTDFHHPILLDMGIRKFVLVRRTSADYLECLSFEPGDFREFASVFG
jgi:hypothetical protein